MELLDLIEYQFNDFQICMRGLITPGYAKENGLSHDQHQEAYLVLGTGVINLIVLTRAIKMGVWNKEDVLNLKRAIANRYALTQIARSLQLEKYIFWGVEERRKQVWLNSKSRLADCLVALLGAIFFDGGLEFAEYVFWKITQYITPEEK